MKSEEQQAREWANAVLSMPGGHYEDNIIAAAELVMEVTTHLTMKGVQWDPSRHFLAGATLESGKEVVMLYPAIGSIWCMHTSDGTTCPYALGELIPNGKRYTIREAGED